MKRNLYIFLIVLFILSACQPSPAGQGQAATATQGATATMIPTNTWTPEPTPTPEASYIINSDFPIISFEELANNYDRIASKFSEVSLEEDVISGKLLEYQLEHIDINNIFPEDVLEIHIFKNGVHSTGSTGEIDRLFVDFLSTNMAKTQPERRNIKAIDFHPIENDEFFTNQGIDPEANIKFAADHYNSPVKWPIWLITWAYKNPSGEVKLIQSTVNIFSFTDWSNTFKEGNYGYLKGSELRPGFIYDYTKIKMSEEDIKKDNPNLNYFIYQNFPQCKPDQALIDEWVDTREMPNQLQNTIFLLTLGNYWK